MQKTLVGYCGECGGDVTVPTAWMGVNPPRPTCEGCGLEARDPNKSTLPMKTGKPPLPRGVLALTMDTALDLAAVWCVRHPWYLTAILCALCAAPDLLLPVM